jgi:pilus assembly protein CpaE
LANPANKRLLVFHANSAAQVVQLEQLNEAVVGQPILALVDPASDPSLMVRAMRAGAAQVVRLPLQEDDFRAAMERIAIQFGHPLNHSRIIMVLGATEGSGVTSIAVNLASEIGRLRNAPCILGEGAIAFGRLANYLNIAPPVTLSDLINDIDHVDIERLRQAITKVEDNLHVITGSHRSIVPTNLTAESVFKLFNYAKQLSDVIVVDGRYAYETIDFEALTQVQQLVLVAQPTVPSLCAIRMLIDALAQQQCLAQQFVVINRFLPNVKEFSIRSLEDVLGIPQVFPVANDYDAFKTAESSGLTLRKAAPHSPALADITTLARVLLGMPAAPNSVGGCFLNAWDHVVHAVTSK